MMKKTLQLTAVIEREDDGYVATCQELDVVSQGDSIEEARVNLVEAVEGFLEAASPSEIKRRLKKQRYVMPIMPVMPDRKRARVEDASHA
ncbi:hypothetical protein U14_01455 [Candidatus Moduliflexus flocculans]|uniref:HicB-like antitoxin of toxin-antitoxin system domain-containing protein n=1 Tax=Candidatus Moduliflexus flocculans TaxID=1499966 RepID=A0A0S6VVP0_9BACT|nr:hypothetical protein U14_01455 [Candidatus Moduliflexus flocculans]